MESKNTCRRVAAGYKKDQEDVKQEQCQLNLGGTSNCWTDNDVSVHFQNNCIVFWKQVLGRASDGIIPTYKGLRV